MSEKFKPIEKGPFSYNESIMNDACAILSEVSFGKRKIENMTEVEASERLREISMGRMHPNEVAYWARIWGEEVVLSDVKIQKKTKFEDEFELDN